MRCWQQSTEMSVTTHCSFDIFARFTPFWFYYSGQFKLVFVGYGYIWSIVSDPIIPVNLDCACLLWIYLIHCIAFAYQANKRYSYHMLFNFRYSELVSYGHFFLAIWGRKEFKFLIFLYTVCSEPGKCPFLSCYEWFMQFDSCLGNVAKTLAVFSKKF